jgi:hypothetical protein
MSKADKIVLAAGIALLTAVVVFWSMVWVVVDGSTGDDDEQQQQQQQQVWLTYSDPLFGMSVHYPENWTREDGPHGVTLTAPDGQSNFIFTLGVDYSPGTGTAKSELRDYVDILRRAAGAPDFRVLEANSTTLGGFPTERATYTYFDDKIITTFTNTQIVAVIDGDDDDIYRVHYSAPSFEWDRLLSTFEHMVESVKIQQ